MFEKEAEEYQTRKHHQRLYGNKPVVMKELNITYKDGFKDGYNKANEWHYVKDGDLPKNNIQVLVLLENERLKTSIFMENKFTVWNKDYKAYTKLYNVIAWKEIVLPEEIKENV